MNNIEFDAFLTNVFRLVRTLVIKIEAVALRDNFILEKAGYSVSSDKSTWRYYMNLNGDYHFTDEVMTVKSVDTGEEIVFNKENLNIHLQTFREYSSGGDLFKRLSSAYEGQSELIRGILAPIPFAETIAADDYKILRYNKNLVLWNEDQLIPQLQAFVNAEASHIFSNEYKITDNLMLPVSIMQLYGDVIKAICTIRFEAIGTRYAHDFLIWSHIDSYGDFSRYKNSLSRFQIMWLYRNIAWLKNNPGQQYTFNKLMKNLLTASDIPLAKFDMVATTANQLEDLTMTPNYRRLQMNLIEDYGRAATFIDTKELIYKQQNLAKDNFAQSSIYYEDALSKGTYSLHSELPTKTLISSMKDYSSRHIDTLMSTVYNEWVFLAGKGLFQGKIMVVDPKNGKSVRLPVGDAFYIWRHLIDLGKGKETLQIEPAFYQNAMKVNPPSVNALVQAGGPAFIHPTMAKGIQDQWVPVTTFIAPEYLMEYSAQVYESKWNHRKIFSQHYDLNLRARVKTTTELMYESGLVTMTTFTAYKDLLKAYELDFTEYTAEEAKNFAWDIFKRITGWDSNSHPSLRTQQNDLIEIMMRLSSYTINVVKEMDDGTDLIELKNELFVGDPKWIGKGNVLHSDFSNAKLDGDGFLDSIIYTETLVPLVDPQRCAFKLESEGAAVIKSRDHFKAVDLSEKLSSYAVRMPDTSYFRMLPLEDIPAPVQDLPPPTYYDQLQFPDDGTPDPQPWFQIPTTDYELLILPGEDPVPFTRLDDDYYGKLKAGGEVAGDDDESGWVVLPDNDLG